MSLPSPIWPITSATCVFSSMAVPYAIPLKFPNAVGRSNSAIFLNEFLRAHAVRDEILYGNQFELVPVGVTAQAL